MKKLMFAFALIIMLVLASSQVDAMENQGRFKRAIWRGYGGFGRRGGFRGGFGGFGGYGRFGGFGRRGGWGRGYYG